MIAPIVQWQFERGHHHLTCAIRAAASAASYEVTTVLLWDGGRTSVETFTRPSEALHRHAAIAADLRAAGWTISAYTDRPDVSWS